MFDLLAGLNFTQTAKLLFILPTLGCILGYIMDEICLRTTQNKALIAIFASVRELLPIFIKFSIFITTYHMIVGTLCVAW